MNKLKQIMDKVLSAVCCILFAAMVVIAVWQVVSRYVLGNPSSISEELLTYSFAWMAMLSATLVFGQRDHMRLSYFADKLAPRRKLWLDLLIEGIIFVFAVLVLIYGGIYISSLEMIQTTPTLGVSMGYIYSIMPVSGALIAVYAVIHMVNLYKEIRRSGVEEDKKI
ncbi:TRAP transporter small permease [Simiaoa sp.]|uniref:TRAP transporter small permease n=1 Tax=Simiaoa sp. TaxID=2944202 RepID=UPI003F7E199B